MTDFSDWAWLMFILARDDAEYCRRALYDDLADLRYRDQLMAEQCRSMYSQTRVMTWRNEETLSA